MRPGPLDDSIPDLPRSQPRMGFPSIQAAAWLAWLAGMACVQAGAAVAFVVMPAALEGQRDASLMGGTLFLGGCVAALGANNALNALQQRPEVVTRWLNSAFFGLAVASFTAIVAGLRGGAEFLTGIGGLPSAARWATVLFSTPLAVGLVVVAVSVLRGGVLKRVEPVKVRTGSPRASMWRWVRRGAGVLVLLISGWCWWTFRAPAMPEMGTVAKGRTLAEWVDQWRESGHTAGVEAFAQSGSAGRSAAVALASEIVTARVQRRAGLLRSLNLELGSDLRTIPPLKPVVLERDISEPVVRVLDRFCTEHDDAAAALEAVVARHHDGPVRARAFKA
ncbi:MAG: hypothetical protein ACYTGX_01755, partial [Planctomycetota bacterium]